MPLSEDVSDNAMTENAETAREKNTYAEQSARGLFSTRELPLFRLPIAESRRIFRKRGNTRASMPRSGPRCFPFDLPLRTANRGLRARACPARDVIRLAELGRER